MGVAGMEAGGEIEGNGIDFGGYLGSFGIQLLLWACFYNQSSIIDKPINIEFLASFVYINW